MSAWSKAFQAKAEGATTDHAIQIAHQVAIGTLYGQWHRYKSRQEAQWAWDSTPHAAAIELALGMSLSYEPPTGIPTTSISPMARSYPFPPPAVLGHPRGVEEFEFPVILSLHDPSEIVLDVWEGPMLRRIESCVLAHATPAGRQARALGLPPSEVYKTIQAMGQAILGEEMWETHTRRTARAPPGAGLAPYGV